jgi:nicotinamidase-related amidase
MISKLSKGLLRKQLWARRVPRHFGPVLGAGLVFALVVVIVAASANAEEPRPLDSKTALVVIDVQAFYFAAGFMPLVNPEVASGNCKKLIEKFRTQELTVIHVGHNVSKGGAFHADVMPIEGEKIVQKDEVSSFNGTDLLDYLKENGIERLVICGMQTHMCVEGAVRAAYDLGFECVLVGDACATRSLEYDDKVIDSADVHSSTLKTLEGGYATVIDTETFLTTY